jgi:prolipoprotein diacylglyceryltransferase
MAFALADRGTLVLHNLGMYEMFFAVVATALMYATKKTRFFDGFQIAIVLLLYSPVRFLLDYLRVADKLYLGLTPGQYFSIALGGIGVALVVRGLKAGPALAVIKAPALPSNAVKTDRGGRQGNRRKKKR